MLLPFVCSFFFNSKTDGGERDHAKRGCDKGKRQKLCNGFGAWEMGGKRVIGVPQ